LAAASLMLMAKPAYAADFTVTNTNDSGAGSLRQEILNANPGADNVRFNIPGTGVKTISPFTGLPAITDTVFTDGYSQPGATESTQLVGTDAKLLIQLDGSHTVGNGLNIDASDVEVQGLVINEFFHGVEIEGGSNVKIEGNS